jgi:hypothetical protein
MKIEWLVVEPQLATSPSGGGEYLSADIALHSFSAINMGYAGSAFTLIFF